MQKLEAEREQRRAQRHMREQQRHQTELQRAGIAGNLALQLNPLILANATLIDQTREYLETYFEKALPELSAPPEADDAEPEAPAEGEAAAEA